MTQTEKKSEQDLTKRQRKALNLLRKQDLAPKAIAKRLGITTNAVYQYRRRFTEWGLLPKEAGTTNGRPQSKRRSARAKAPAASSNGRPSAEEIISETDKVIGAAMDRIDTARSALDEEREALEAQAEELQDRLVLNKGESEKLDAKRAALEQPVRV